MPTELPFIETRPQHLLFKNVNSTTLHQSRTKHYFLLCTSKVLNSPFMNVFDPLGGEN